MIKTRQKSEDYQCKEWKRHANGEPSWDRCEQRPERYFRSLHGDTPTYGLCSVHAKLWELTGSVETDRNGVPLPGEVGRCANYCDEKQREHQTGPYAPDHDDQSRDLQQQAATDNKE